MSRRIGRLPQKAMPESGRMGGHDHGPEVDP
jgi:hypothetical protein